MKNMDLLSEQNERALLQAFPSAVATEFSGNADGKITYQLKGCENSACLGGLKRYEYLAICLHFGWPLSDKDKAEYLKDLIEQGVYQANWFKQGGFKQTEDFNFKLLAMALSATGYLHPNEKMHPNAAYTARKIQISSQAYNKTWAARMEVMRLKQLDWLTRAATIIGKNTRFTFELVK